MVYGYNWYSKDPKEIRKNIVKLRFALLDTASGDPHLNKHI